MYVVLRSVAVEVIVHAPPLRERHGVAERHGGIILAENAGICVKADGTGHFPVVKVRELTGAEKEADSLIVQRPREGGGVGEIGIERVLHYLKSCVGVLVPQRCLQQRAQLRHVGHNVAHRERAPGRGVKVCAVIVVIAVHAAGKACHAVKYADGAAVGARERQIVIAVEHLKRGHAAVFRAVRRGGLGTLRRGAAVIIVRGGREELPIGRGTVRRAVAVERGERRGKRGVDCRVLVREGQRRVGHGAQRCAVALLAERFCRFVEAERADARRGGLNRLIRGGRGRLRRRRARGGCAAGAQQQRGERKQGRNGLFHIAPRCIGRFCEVSGYKSA